MANKDVSVKNATDKELSELIFRLRKERECLDILASLRQRTNDITMEYNSFAGISSEEPVSNLYHEANKSLTIKSATDQELNELIKRLRKENEAQNLICDIKRQSQTRDEAMAEDNYYNSFGVSTETPIENMYHNVDDVTTHFGKLGVHDTVINNVLQHFGISGMRWGRRKSSFRTIRVKSGNSSDHDKAQVLKTKGMKALSNDQINTLLKRLNLEKQMRDTKVSELKRGEEMAKTILGIGTTVAAIYGLSKTPLGEAIKNKMRGR